MKGLQKLDSQQKLRQHEDNNNKKGEKKKCFTGWRRAKNSQTYNHTHTHTHTYKKKKKDVYRRKKSKLLNISIELHRTSLKSETSWLASKIAKKKKKP